VVTTIDTKICGYIKDMYTKLIKAPNNQSGKFRMQLSSPINSIQVQISDLNKVNSN
jgi:hypothetical protein